MLDTCSKGYTTVQQQGKLLLDRLQLLGHGSREEEKDGRAGDEVGGKREEGAGG